MNTYYVERDDGETLVVEGSTSADAARQAADLMPATDLYFATGHVYPRATHSSTFRVYLLDRFDRFQVAVEAL